MEQMCELPDDYMTPEEVGKILKVSPFTIRRWAREGKIPHDRVGPDWKHIRIRRSVVQSLIRPGHTTSAQDR